MVKTRLREFGYTERRPMSYVIRIIYRTENSQITICKGTLIKTIRELLRRI
jgi:hypothetical protein